MVNVVGERVRLRVKKVRVVQRVKKGKFWLIVIAKSRTWRRAAGGGPRFPPRPTVTPSPTLVKLVKFHSTRQASFNFLYLTSPDSSSHRLG